MPVLFAVYSNSLGKNAISLGSERGFPKNYALICSVQHSLSLVAMLAMKIVSPKIEGVGSWWGGREGR